MPGQTAPALTQAERSSISASVSFGLPVGIFRSGVGLAHGPNEPTVVGIAGNDGGATSSTAQHGFAAIEAQTAETRLWVWQG